ncbi:MAG: hypothetical protein U0893_26855 [Chloroflexota bacterium]
MRPDPQGRPIAVFDPTRRLRPLLEAPDTRGEGRGASLPRPSPLAPHPSPLVHVGLALREAEARWPDVAYRRDAPTEYAQAIEPVLSVLAELSPTVEWSSEPEGTAAAARHELTARYAIFLDGTGLAGLYGSEERLAQTIAREVPERTGHQVRVGIADGRYAALLAAEEGGVIVPAGGDAAFLAPLPVSLLPLPPEARERVVRLGAQTLADFRRLPANALRHRFGPDGVVALALALGRDEGPLRPRPIPLQLHEAISLEWVETSMDRLLFLLKQLTDRLSVRLGQYGLGCGRLRVHWLLDASGLTTGDDPIDSPSPAVRERGLGGRGDTGAPWWDGEGFRSSQLVSTIRLSEPAGSGASLLEHLRWHVEGLRPEMFRDPETGRLRGVHGLFVEAEELGPLGGRQLALLPGEDGRATSPERVLAAERALARLQARWGEEAVQQAELIASRRPERAFRWREGALALQLPGAEGISSQRVSLNRALRTPRPSVRRSSPRSPLPNPSPSQGGGVGEGVGAIHRAPTRTTLVGARFIAPSTPHPSRARGIEGGGFVWLTGEPEEVQIERSQRLPGGRRRPGAIVQGQKVRRIVRAAGPWRLVERWVAEPVARDAYHVVLTDGAACWLVHDRLADRWLLFGTFD